MIKKLVLIFILLMAGFTAVLMYQQPHTGKKDIPVTIALDSIRTRGKLIAVTDFNSVDYFIYKGEPMGFNYELLKSFSDFIGIDLEIVAENSIERASEMVNSGEADILAFGLDKNSSLNDIVLSTPLDQSSQVLIQRKPENWRKMTADSLEKRVVRNTMELKDQLIYVQAHSSHVGRLASIEKEIGGKMNIIAVPYESEKLIQLVDRGEIDFSVCDSNIATVDATYYPDIDIRTKLGPDRGLAWGVRKSNSDDLLKELNRWILSFRNTSTFSLLHAKYFSNSWSSIMIRSDYYSLNTGKVSGYDDLIKKFSPVIDWDWRLLAALICQESEFRPDVVSLRGAYGLMQVMPLTGRNFGIDITASPENNIKAGILYINWLNSIFETKVVDKQERLHFILASYNAGPGHVLDAMRLAEKNGMDPGKWEGSVAIWLLKKSEPRYYNDEVVKNGYFKGTESVKFVTDILGRFEHYKNIIPEQKSRPYGE